MANQAWMAGWARGAGQKQPRDTDSDKPADPKKKKKASAADADTGSQVRDTVRARGFAPATPLPGFDAPIKSKKKGGPIKKTGVFLLHKGEYVVPAKRGSRGKTTHKRSVIKA